MLTNEKISSNYKNLRELNLGVKIHPVICCSSPSKYMDFMDAENTGIIVLYRTKGTEWIFHKVPKFKFCNYVFFYKGNEIHAVEYNKRIEMGLKHLIELNGGDSSCIICLEEVEGLICCRNCSASYCSKCMTSMILHDVGDIQKVIQKCQSKGISPYTSTESVSQEYIDHTFICCQCKQKNEFEISGSHIMRAIVSNIFKK